MKMFMRMLRGFYRRCGQHRRKVWAMFVLVTISGLFQASIPRVSGLLLDAIVADPSGFVARWFWPFLLMVFMATIFYGIIDYGQKMAVTLASVEVSRRYQTDLYAQLLHLDEGFYQRRQAGDIAMRLSKDVDEGIDPLLYSAAQLTFALMVGSLSTIILFNLHPVFGLAFIILLPFWLVFGRYVLKRSYALSKVLKDEFGKLNARATEDMTNQALIRIFAKEDDRGHNFRQAAEQYRDRAIRLGRFTTAASSVQKSLVSFVLPLAMVTVCIPLIDQDLTAGSVFAAYATWTFAYMPISMCMFHIPRIMSCFASLRRVFEFFDEVPSVQDAQGARPLTPSGGVVRFSQVDFAYPAAGDKPAVPVLQQVNLTLPAGKSCAVVGATGSGKSTLASLLLRFYDVSAGEVTIDGQDIRQVTQHSLRRAIGIVQQESQLWAGTVRENLAFACPHASEQDMLQALDRAVLSSFIRFSPDGLDTVLGERGVRLSGGQRQRLALARLFLLSPAIVILDEATSALDGLAERAVQQAMAELLKDRTALIIAHRLSTIIDCDHIVVMRHGQIVDQGTHRALRQRCAYYNELCQQQNLAA